MNLTVEEKLKKMDITYTLIPLSGVAMTVDDVIAFSNGQVREEEICKTIIVRGKKTNQKFAVVLRGRDKLDWSKAKKFFQEEVTTATPAEVLDVTGVEPGAVCPLLLKINLFIDAKVLTLHRVNIGSGDHMFGLEVLVRDMIEHQPFVEVQLAKNVLE